MPPATPPAAGAGASAGRPAPPPGAGILQGLMRAFFMWWVMKQFTGAGKKAAVGPDGKPAPVARLVPRMQRGALVDMHLYISDSEDWRVAAAGGIAHAHSAVDGADGAASAPPPPAADWTARDVPVGALAAPRTARLVYRPTPHAQANGSVWAHAVFTPPGSAPAPGAPGHLAEATWARSARLNAWHPRRKAAEGKNLLSGKNSTDDAPMPEGVLAANATAEVISYLRPNITITMVDDFSAYPAAAVPPQFKEIIELADDGSYWPHAWHNTFWVLRDHMLPVNATLESMEVDVTLESAPAWKVALLVQMTQSFSLQAQWGMSSGDEADEVKRIFLEGNPFLLALTVLVSLLHSVFDVLAFKNDIGFWKENKSMAGLSARSVAVNAACQVVIFLYLLDEETSMVVLASAGVGAAIEIWKVTRAFEVALKRTATGLPYPSIRDRASYSASETARHDADAMRYMSYALYPLVLGYAAYSLAYKPHRSWYSWVLNTAVSSVYMFGFVLMCPQLYLNWKLKSVAHLPWRQLTYKFLSTIVDDLFAFVIKMPTLHRLAVFRDDLVFVVYLIQWKVYGVDRARRNEYGYSPADEAARLAGGGAAAPAPALAAPPAAEGAAAGESGADEGKKEL